MISGDSLGSLRLAADDRRFAFEGFKVADGVEDERSAVGDEEEEIGLVGLVGKSEVDNRVDEEQDDR